MSKLKAVNFFGLFLLCLSEMAILLVVGMTMFFFHRLRKLLELTKNSKMPESTESYARYSQKRFRQLTEVLLYLHSKTLRGRDNSTDVSTTRVQ